MPQNIRAIVERQIARWNNEREQLKRDVRNALTPRPVITVSRQLGSAGAEIAKEVAMRLECELIGFRIINEIAERTDMRQDLVDQMDERTRNQVGAWLKGMITGEHLHEGDFHHYLLQTVRSFAELGSVVILGRGGAFIPTGRPRVNVRVIAPMEQRIERVQRREKCDRQTAVNLIDISDRERARFVKRLFDADWNDPLHYDLVINTADLQLSAAAAVIEAIWLRYVTDFRRDVEETETR